ncbi:MAG TPA: hypothetical protein VGW78_05540, partial [Candidatus Babeliales bacterium]|nr:hypothetical protein [Candidatus Babeliales bacterium]
FDNENFVYNWVGDACGWKQPFCIKCLSPEQCACALPTTEAALYRAQCAMHGFDIVQEHGGWLWKPRQSIAIYKTCIESPLLQRIGIDHIEFKKSRADWKDLYTPKHYYRNSIKSYIIPYSSKPTFNPDNSVGIYEITSKYEPHLYDYNAIQRCINTDGEYRNLFLEILFDSDDNGKYAYSLASISYMPKFVDTLLKAKKRYPDGYVSIHVNKILSDVYNLRYSDIELLRDMLPKNKDYHQIPKILGHLFPVAAARCAQIGGASEEIIWHFLSEYEKAHTKRYDYLYISPFGKLRFVGKDPYIESTRDIDPLPILAKYTIDNADQFHQEIETYYRDITPQYTYHTHTLNYFIEICRKANSWCKLNVWTRGIAESSGYTKYTCTQHHMIESDDRFASIDNTTYMIPFAQSTKLAIIIGSMLHHIQKIDNKSEVRSVPLLTDTEHQKGYTIEDIDNITSDDTITVHIKSVHWWEHFFRPIKKIYLNSLQVKQGWNIKRTSFNPFTILQPFFLTWFNTIKSLLISHPI